MSYATRFRYDYNEAYPQSLGRGVRRYRVDFNFRDYSGPITELLPGGSPYIESISDNSDQRWSPLNPWKFSFDIACQDFWDAQAFYVNDDTQIQVVISLDETGTGNSFAIHRVGFISATDLKEPYGPKPYIVSISALDGLTLLKNRPMLDSAGKRFAGQVTLSHAIRAALALTGTNLTLVVGDNLYNLPGDQMINGHADPSRCPLFRNYINSERFVDDSGNTRMAWDVLKEMLEPRGLRLSQTKGQWWVLRGDEAAGGWDVGDDATPTSIHTRTYNSEGLAAGPFAPLHTSRELGIQVSSAGTTRVNEGTQWLPQYQNGIRIEQSFGRYLSKLGDFSQVDGTGLPIGYTTNNLNVADRYVSGSGTDLDPYALSILGSGDEKFNISTPYVHLKVNYGRQGVEFSRFNKRTFKGRARLTNIRAAKMVFIAEGEVGSYILAGGDWKFTNLQASDLVGLLQYNIYVDQAGHQKNATGWFDYTIDLGTIDRVQALHIYYCQGEALDHYNSLGQYDGPETGQTNGIRPKVEYQAGKLIVEQQGQAIDGIQRTIVRPGQVVKDTTLSIVLGDVPDAAHPYDRIGTTFSEHVDYNVTTTLWFYPDADILDPNPTGRNIGKTQLEWLAQSRASQVLAPALSWEGTLIGALPHGIHTVVYINDIGDPDGNGGIIHYALAITRIGESNSRLMSHKVTLTRIMPLLDSFADYDRKAEWQTPDGLLPISFDAGGKPAAPNTPTPQSKRDLFLQQLSLSGQTAKLTGGVTTRGFQPIQSGAIGAALLGATVRNNGRDVATVLARIQKAVNLNHFIQP